MTEEKIERDAALEAAILRLTRARGPDKSICPSDAAKAAAAETGADWRALLPGARRLAVRLAVEGRLVVLRNGKPVDPTDFRGVYRLSAPRQG